ncbi:arylamine N-acetyltransferase family protein [Neisseria montereyensis]|uniref:Arylamine N-acetyltransferase n=1 Tax=Neisseria montereyensis TaxID=2973938 RepID=A0ABT2FAK9_9NEIS|nr:arylamine N-acetyltransferase [Neisseria montereyensis]MCS4533197.1 arylamine N-acetyltransferase [Neisseria montereyensis]
MDIQKIAEGYLKALNITDDIKTLEDVCRLMRAHLKAFCFGNAKILVGETVPIDIESVYENLVVKKRGGYCFEQNKLIYEVLKAKGFEVSQHLARIVNNEKPRIPLTHRVTLLYYQGDTYVIDVGVGFRSPCVALKLNAPQPTMSHLGIQYHALPVDEQKGIYMLQMIQKGEKFNINQFDLIENIDSDFEVSNFYCYMNPKTIWRNHLIISRLGDDVIYSLRDNRYFKIYDTHTERMEIKEFNQFANIMEKELNADYTQDELTILFDNYIKGD